MDISNKIPPVSHPASVKAIQSIQKAAARPVAAARPGEDQVTLSDLGRTMQSAREQLAGMPEVDEKKVAEMKDSIEKGTYQVDGGRIAARMIAEALLNDL